VDSVGKRESTYRNINGNKNGDLRFMINKSLFNRKFSVNSTSNIGYSESNGFINGDLNTTGDLSLRGNVRYSKTDKSLAGQISSEVFNYGGNANTTIYLPWNFGISSDLNYSTNSGYSDGFKQNEWLWNASIQKQVFKDKGGTIKFSMYDILHQRSNISRTSGAQSLRYTASNTVGSYFIFSFTYRFRNFKGDQQRRGFRDRNSEDGNMPERPVREGGRGRFGGERGDGFIREGFDR
jgi:hypothetical protein